MISTEVSFLAAHNTSHSLGLASTHEAVLPKHDARSAVRAWYRTNGVAFGRHDTNVLSLMTAAVNMAELAVPKAGRPAVKRAVGRKNNPVRSASSEDDSTSESSSFLLLNRFLLHESSRRGFDCYEGVSSDMVSANASIISTRWVISKKINDDCTWRSKARLVARGHEDKEKDRVSSDSPVASSAAQRLVLALLAENGFQTLGTLQQPFCKVSPSLVTFLSCSRYTLSCYALLRMRPQLNS
jgi:hypothetical protein